MNLFPKAKFYEKWVKTISLHSCSCCKIAAYFIHTHNYKGLSLNKHTLILEWLWLNRWVSWKSKLLARRGVRSQVCVSHSCYIFHSRHKIYSLKRHFLFEIVTGFEKNNTFQALFAHCKETQTGYKQHLKNSLPVTFKNLQFSVKGVCCIFFH